MQKHWPRILTMSCRGEVRRCMPDQWLAGQALVSYGRAEDLGDPEAKLMNAYTLRKVNDSSAFTVAEEYFRLTQSQECAESLAEWHYEDGSLADAASWLNKPNSCRSVVRALQS